MWGAQAVVFGACLLASALAWCAPKLGGQGWPRQSGDDADEDQLPPGGRTDWRVFIIGAVWTAGIGLLAMFVWPHWGFMLSDDLPPTALATQSSRVRDSGLRVATAVAAATAGWLAVRRFELSRD